MFLHVHSTAIAAHPSSLPGPATFFGRDDLQLDTQVKELRSKDTWKEGWTYLNSPNYMHPWWTSDKSINYVCVSNYF